MALFHREKGVVGLLVHSGTKRTGDQVLSLLQHAAGETVPVSQLEKAHDIKIVAFSRADGRLSSVPSSKSVLHHGDSVLVCVRHSEISHFDRWIQA